MGQLDGRVLLVAGEGEQAATAVSRLVSEGARILFASADSTLIGTVIGALGHNYVDGATATMSDPKSAARAVAQAVRRFRRLDGAVLLISSDGPHPFVEAAVEGLNASGASTSIITVVTAPYAHPTPTEEASPSPGVHRLALRPASAEAVPALSGVLVRLIVDPGAAAGKSTLIFDADGTIRPVNE